jgi:putative SOS response-associated peptidase YedK
LPIHDRMPVIVPPERYAQWLDRAQDDSVLLASHGGALKLDR